MRHIHSSCLTVLAIAGLAVQGFATHTNNTCGTAMDLVGNLPHDQVYDLDLLDAAWFSYTPSQNTGLHINTCYPESGIGMAIMQVQVAADCGALSDPPEFEPINYDCSISADGGSYFTVDCADYTFLAGTTYYFLIQDMPLIGGGPLRISFEECSTADVSDLPLGFELATNVPNPFNPSTRIDFSLPATGMASLKVYDLRGQEIAVLAEGILAGGEHSMSFDGAALASGVYIYHLESAGYSLSRKMALIK